MKKIIIEKKLLMHAMLDAIENDFICYVMTICDIELIPKELVDKGLERTDNEDLKNLLQQLDLGDFIKIINVNISNTNFSKKEKDFMNKELIKIIPIRNRVMHPRPLEFNDDVILKNVFDNINIEIKNIQWQNVSNLKKMIISQSDELLNLKVSRFHPTSDILENLPIPEFDDTTFIGREKELSELKKLILDDQFKIISIIGEGGVGKTAITVKLLYDFLDNSEFKYDAIIWSTLKTQQLDKLGFSQIDNAISTVKQLQEKVTSFIPSDDNLTSEESIVSFAQNFKTILVLDNLETISTKDIKEFILEFSKYGKLIITSRIGLGELEYRYLLSGLKENEAIKYMKSLLGYYGLQDYLTDSEIKKIAYEDLFSNPLTIKWFVRSLYNGEKVSDILKNKQKIVSFCMNNVYDKLSKTSIEILNLLVVENRSLTHAELAFYLDIDYANDINIRKAINEISKSNFIEDNYCLNENINLTKMSYDYLRLNHYPKKKFVDNVIEKRKKISIIKQDMEIKKEFDMFNPKSISFLNSPEKIISATYLLKALEFSAKGLWSDAFNSIELAKQITPNYFECYKISAFLYAIKKDGKALSEYELALQLCENDEERSIVYVLLGNYCLDQQDDRLLSLEYFNRALEHNKHTYIYFCKVKSLTYLGKYNEALTEMEKIAENSLSTLKYKNMYYCRYADIYFRMAQLDGKKDPSNTFENIKKGIEILEKTTNGDYKLYNLYVKALFTLSLFYYNDDIIEFVINKIEKNYYKFKNITKYKTLSNLLLAKYDLIKSENKSKLLVYICDYKKIATKISEENKGIIVFMNKGYGFLSNKIYSQNLYFNYNDKEDLHIGEIVEFDIYEDNGKKQAINLKKQPNGDEILRELGDKMGEKI